MDLSSLPRAVILDRDGTITQSNDLVLTPERMRVEPAAARAIARLNALGTRVALATNQGAVGRGLLSLAQLGAIHKEMQRQLRLFGATVDQVEFCPHHPDATIIIERFCTCRKPAPGMLIRIAEAFDLASDDCVMIGDNYSDLEAARSAGMSAVLVLTGHGPIHRERALRDGFEIASDLQSWVKSRSTEVPDAERFF